MHTHVTQSWKTAAVPERFAEFMVRSHLHLLRGSLRTSHYQR